MNTRAHLLLLPTCLALLMTACMPRPPVTGEPKQPLATMVITPTTIAPPAASGPQAVAALEKGAGVLTEIVQHYMATTKIPGVRFINQDQLEGALAARTGSRHQLTQAIGHTFKADAVLTLELRRFREREGGEYSITRPASLAFAYRLTATADGNTLCSGLFDQSQQALFDDLLSFKFKRGVRWQTIHEFAEDAIEEKFSQCAYLLPHQEKP